MAQDRSLEFEEAEEFNSPKGENYLLSIGINAYEHFNPLHNAVLDATTIRDLLIDQYQFSKKNSITLLNEEATRENILDTLEAMEGKLKPEDNFLLYFAGHGSMNVKKTQGFWIPIEAQKRNSQYIRNTSILEILKDFEAKHIYLLVDSCFSGSMILRSGEENINLLEHLPSRRVLTSGRKEVVSDGRPGQHSPFAKCIISYLKDNNGGVISSKDLEYHVEKNVARTTTQNPESAFLFGLGDQSGQFVFRSHGYQPKQVAKEPLVSTFGSTPQNEAEAYAQANQTGTLKALQEYLSEFPDGALNGLAQSAIIKLEKVGKPVPQSPIEMILIEGGTFQMTKNYKVELSSYEIGKYPVTQKEWQDIMGNNPSRFKGENLPVEKVSWNDAMDFLKKINQIFPNFNYCLATEAEWEFAARGGNKSKGFTYAGSNDLEEVGWYYKNSKNNTHPVGEKKANELGIYDMSGNVWEWCDDWYGDYPNGKFRNPSGPINGSDRVMRGGCWGFVADRCPVSQRSFCNPYNNYDVIGFRLARSL